jgi:Fungal specific transcription factor domain
MLGIAIRIAQRMGIHNESTLARCTVLEAEMRRRLWWSLVLFDTRIGEIANYNNVTLDPTWDCRIPLNVNDSDLRPEMKEPPSIQGKTSEAIFAVVRGELGDFIRHTLFHLDFSCPALKPIVKLPQNRTFMEDDELVKLEETIEGQYLKSCDPDNPLHYITIWTTRARLSKCRLLEHHSRYSSSSVRPTEAQRDAATSHALSLLKCDTKIMSSPLTKGFAWLNHAYFPFPAYIQIVQDLRRRPISDQSRHAWEVMSENYDAWFDSQYIHDISFFQIFSRIVLQAWETYEATSMQLGETLTAPKIVLSIRHVLAQAGGQSSHTDTDRPNVIMSMGTDDIPTPMPMPMSMGFADQSLLYSMEMQDDYAAVRPDIFSITSRQTLLNARLNQFNWATLGGPQSW